LSEHGVIALDTCVLIYYLEGHPVFNSATEAIITGVVRGLNQATVSTMALLELQVGPYAKGLSDMAEEYYDMLGSLPNFHWIPLTYAIADRAARLRAEHYIETPDAVHLATAMDSGATLFVTSDRDLPEIEQLEYLLLR